MEHIRKRKSEISALNVFLCMLVIFIHVSSAPVTSFEKSSLQYAVVFLLWRYANFAVQGFIFLGGLRFFLSKRDDIDYIKFYKDRFIKIIIPYIVWNFIYYFYFISEGYFSFSFHELALKLLSGKLVSPFYFVIVIIQFYALAPLWRLLVKKFNMTPVLILSGVLTLLSGQFLPALISLIFPGYTFQYNDRIFTTYLVYWLAGCYVGTRFDLAKAWVKKHRDPIIVIFILALLAEGALGYINFSGIKHIGWLENIHFFYCASAVLFFFTIFSLYFKNRDIRSKVILETDRAAYLIFLTHSLVIFIINDVMANLGITSISLAYIIRILTVYSITLTACLLWNRSKSYAISAYRKRKQKIHT